MLSACTNRNSMKFPNIFDVNLECMHMLTLLICGCGLLKFSLKVHSIVLRIWHIQVSTIIIIFDRLKKSIKYKIDYFFVVFYFISDGLILNFNQKFRNIFFIISFLKDNGEEFFLQRWENFLFWIESSVGPFRSR